MNKNNEENLTKNNSKREHVLKNCRVLSVWNKSLSQKCAFFFTPIEISLRLSRSFLRSQRNSYYCYGFPNRGMG